MQKIQIIKSQRGKPKLIFNNYMYVTDHHSIKWISWRCATRDCKGKIYTDLEMTNIIKIKPHYHNNEEHKIKKLIFTNNLIQKSKFSNMKFDEAIVSESNKLEESTLKNIGNIDNLRDYYKKLRNIGKNQGINDNEALLNIFKFTHDGRLFLRYDIKTLNNSRILIFFTDISINLIKRSKCLLADATFKLAPKNFSQILVIHVLFFGKVLPICYAIMENKDMESYKLIFEKLTTHIGTFDGTFITDFELALVKSISILFPACKLAGCNFHFSQIVWRNIQNLNLTMFYKNDKEFKTLVKYLLLLSYVPTDNITNEFLKIKEKYYNNIERKKIIDYFEENFISSNNSGIITKNFTFWNVYERLLKHYPTTTNSLEAWHKHMNSKIYRKSQNITKIIDILKSEENKTNIMKNNIISGNYRIKKRKNVFKIIINYSFYIDFEYFEILKNNIYYSFEHQVN